MIYPFKQLLTVIVILLCANGSWAATEANICAELSPYFVGNQESRLPDPSRSPSEVEYQLVEQSKIELLEQSDYDMGVLIVDADNDGKEDLLAWSIQGSGRFVYAETFSLPSRQDEYADGLVSKAHLDLGVLSAPSLVRFRGINYFVSTDTGDEEGISLSRLEKVANGRYEQQAICDMKTTVIAQTSCRHPACKKLQEIVDNTRKNGPFMNVAWPHKYLGQAGLEVYFHGDWSDGDIDNTGTPTSIWRIGRKDYLYENIYWALLGLETEEEVDPALRPTSDSVTVRSVLPGAQHDRLRRTLAQQSDVLSRALHRSISLPKAGEFFLFNANKNRTYWAWDFGEPPYGQEIYIVYTNAKKSDYIGMMRVKRNLVLQPCVSECNTARLR